MATASSTYVQLVGYLADDPDNEALLADAAHAAYEAGRHADAIMLAARHRAVTGQTPSIDYLSGMAAMATRDWDGAILSFRALLAAGVDESPVRFNLAWSLAMTGAKDEALDLLDERVVESLPQAAELRVGLLHERGDLEEAEALARAAIVRFPDHRGLAAAVSTLAIDLDDLDLARITAGRAGDHPAALATLATLALDEDRADEAGPLFEAALARDPNNARARVGRGLVALAADDRARATAELDRGAALFGGHLGSWIAAGWAHVLAGDHATARARFDRALAIDHRFAEAHGSLAILDLLAGDVERARHGAAIALRLDRDSFSGALAAALLAKAANDTARAERIVSLALSTPVDASGRTIGAALARLGARR